MIIESTEEPTPAPIELLIVEETQPPSEAATSEAVTSESTIEPVPTVDATIAAPTVPPTALPETSLAQPTAAPTPVVEATLFPTIQPTLLPEAKSAEPILVAGAIADAGWSNDGQWLAYWVSSANGVASATLHFYNVRSSEACSVETLTRTEPREQDVVWQADNSVWVMAGTVSYQGQPCNAASFVEFTPPATVAIEGVSPDGSWRISTVETTRANGVIGYQTDIVSTATGQLVQSATWRIDERLVNDDVLGGTWVSRSQFLIYETLRQGPLLLDAENGTIQSVLTDLFELEEIPSQLDTVGVSLRAYPLFNIERDRFHLLVAGVGIDRNFPLVQIYHAENGLIETLPYRHVWEDAFSADSQQIILDENLLISNRETHTLVMRGLEDEDGMWRHFAFDVGKILWHEDSVVYSQSDQFIVWQNFPSGDNLHRIDTGPYRVMPTSIAPDGLFAAAIGRLAGQAESGLFILKK